MNTLTPTLKRLNGRLITALVLLGLLLTPLGASASPAYGPTVEVIVQGSDMATAAELVRSVGGTVTHELGIINAVGAQLTPTQLAALQRRHGIARIYENRRVEVAGSPDDTIYPTLVGADLLHAQGITGDGVTVAVLDTGLFYHKGLTKDADHKLRLLAEYNAILDQMEWQEQLDESGHGSHVTSIVLSSNKTSDKLYNGIAPSARLVAVQAFGADGAGSYMDVIRGLDWVVTNKDTFNIRVLNLSFSAPPQSYYWDDPLNQAVMRAWQAGIVVVASAGNTGPDAMTIGVPGNVPYVITVGAMSDNYTRVQ